MAADGRTLAELKTTLGERVADPNKLRWSDGSMVDYLNHAARLIFNLIGKKYWTNYARTESPTTVSSGLALTSAATYSVVMDGFWGIDHITTTGSAPNRHRYIEEESDEQTILLYPNGRDEDERVFYRVYQNDPSLNSWFIAPLSPANWGTGVLHVFYYKMPEWYISTGADDAKTYLQIPAQFHNAIVEQAAAMMFQSDGMFTPAQSAMQNMGVILGQAIAVSPGSSPISDEIGVPK